MYKITVDWNVFVPLLFLIFISLMENSSPTPWTSNVSVLNKNNKLNENDIVTTTRPWSTTPPKSRLFHHLKTTNGSPKKSSSRTKESKRPVGRPRKFTSTSSSSSMVQTWPLVIDHHDSDATTEDEMETNHLFQSHPLSSNSANIFPTLKRGRGRPKKSTINWLQKSTFHLRRSNSPVDMESLADMSIREMPKTNHQGAKLPPTMNLLLGLRKKHYSYYSSETSTAKMKRKGKKYKKNGLNRRHTYSSNAVLSNHQDQKYKLAATSQKSPHLSSSSTSHQDHLQKPREERSYKEFFPDLDLNAQLLAIWSVPTHLRQKSKSPNRKVSSSLANESHNENSAVHYEDHSSSSNTTKYNSSPSLRHPPSIVSNSKVGDSSLRKTNIRTLSEDELAQNARQAQCSRNSKAFKDVTSSFQQKPWLGLTDAYIKNTEPDEEGLMKLVEYDLDDQDRLWLEEVNKVREADGISIIEPEFLELLIDRLEKEWFNLTKDLRKEAGEPLTPEDSVCNICESGECENMNAIVFCDGCNLAVHQECYGIPYIPEGQWLCRKCMLSPEQPVVKIILISNMNT